MGLGSEAGFFDDFSVAGFSDQGFLGLVGFLFVSLSTLARFFAGGAAVASSSESWGSTRGRNRFLLAGGCDFGSLVGAGSALAF